MSAFFERLRAAARARQTQICVGLDPDPERIAGGVAGALRHCRQVVELTAEHACCYKPNSAFWEQYGPDGWRALAELRAGIPADIPVLFDGKRADIGLTMRAYARAIFEQLGMDAATVHAYHGPDSLAEFTRYRERGVYVVARSSNPGAAALQHLDVEGVPLYIRVAQLAENVNAAGNVGLVLGTTAPAQVREVRGVVPALPFLLPGVGAQGGDLEASVEAAWSGDEASCLVASSRAILYASDPAAAALDLKRAVNAVLARVT